ncbi:hypothetical protein [Rhizobacter sp. Root1221]|uniref:hypothetical protein n=1 Tax=Rhizobacter sp. Root1221 TaxID=1736433 RepID=UPI0006FD6623|nr:hypothetical protein [Rhizobacter sp. Root1221]KQV99988.1 hypothetical protein ASC87_20010 [Rhizobacter sp. Root1221]
MTLSRQREQDIAPLATSMTDAALTACLHIWQRSGRPKLDLSLALLLTAAQLGAAAREAGALTTTDWARANRSAQDPTSLLNTSPALPPANASHG